MPSSSHALVIVPDSHLVRFPDGHHLDLEGILLSFLKVVALVLQFDVVRLALVAIETKENVGVRPRTGYVACGDRYIPHFP